MAGFLDEIVAASESGGLRSLHVPEWDKTIWWRPPTLAERDNIRASAANNDARAVAKALILLARDEAGQKLMPDNAESLAAVMGRLDGAVVARVAKAMLGAEGGGQAGES